MIRFNSFNYGAIFGYGSGNSLYSNLSQLTSARSGAYAKGLKSYYGRNNQTAQKNTAVNKYNYGTYSQLNGLSNVSKESTELSAAARKLTDTGRNALFADKEKYDADKAYKAVSDFVTNYNEALDAANKTVNMTVSSAAGSMNRITGVMTGNLGQVGITVASDGRMSVNEEDFKNADFDKVKSMFGSNGSFAGIIGSSAQRLNSAAEQQSRQMALFSNSGIYGRYGSYFGGYGGYGLLGSGFDSLF